MEAVGEKAMNPELSYLLSDRGVAKRTRGLIGHIGIHRMNVFAKIETNETEFRAWAKDSLGLNPAADPAARIALAVLVDAWKAMCKAVNEQGCTLQTALTQAFSNVELRAKYFITPLAVSSRAEGPATPDCLEVGGTTIPGR